MDFPYLNKVTQESPTGAKIGAYITTIRKLKTFEVKRDKSIHVVLGMIQKEEYFNACKILEQRALNELYDLGEYHVKLYRAHVELARRKKLREQLALLEKTSQQERVREDNEPPTPPAPIEWTF